MKSRVNLDAALSEQQFADTMGQISSIFQTFNDFSVHLSKKDKLRLTTVGPNRSSMIIDVLDAAQSFEGMLPRDMDIKKFEKSVATLRQMNKLLLEVMKLNEMLNDTKADLGALVMHYALQVYNALKAARDRDTALDDIVSIISKNHFSKKSNSQEKVDDTKTTPPEKEDQNTVTPTQNENTTAIEPNDKLD